MTLPLVSCVMATRDRANFVDQSIQCFLNQRYSERELIIVDHGVDETNEVVARYADTRIHYVRLDAPQMVTGDVKNHGFTLARGEYIAIWDDDDWYHPSRVGLQIQALQAASADLCYLKREILVWNERNRYAYSQSRLWENSLVGKADRILPYGSMQRGGDSVQTRSMLTAERKIVYLDASDLYLYRIHARNVWHAEHFERFFESASADLPLRAVSVVAEKLVQK